MTSVLTEPAITAHDRWAQVRPIRRIAVAVGVGDGGHFTFHAVDGDDACTAPT